MHGLPTFIIQARPDRAMVSERRVVCWRDVLKLMSTPGLPEVRLSDTFHSTTFILSETLKYLKPAQRHQNQFQKLKVPNSRWFFAIPFLIQPLGVKPGQKTYFAAAAFWDRRGSGRGSTNGSGFVQGNTGGWLSGQGPGGLHRWWF